MHHETGVGRTWRRVVVGLSLLALAAMGCEADGAAGADTIGPGGGDAEAPDTAAPTPAEDVAAVEDSGPPAPQPVGPCTIENRDPGTSELREIVYVVWDGERVDYREVDRGGDGTVDDRWEMEYDAEGRILRYEGAVYPLREETQTYTYADDGRSYTVEMDQDSDGDVDSSLVVTRDEQGRALSWRISENYVLTFSDFDEWDNPQRREALFGDELYSVCTASWRGPRALLQEECVRASDDAVLSRRTVTYEGDRPILEVGELDEQGGGGPLTEWSRQEFVYDARGWLVRHTWYQADDDDFELTFGYACWE